MIHFFMFSEKEIKATNDEEGRIKERAKDEEKKDAGDEGGAAPFAATVNGQKKHYLFRLRQKGQKNKEKKRLSAVERRDRRLSHLCRDHERETERAKNIQLYLRQSIHHQNTPYM